MAEPDLRCNLKKCRKSLDGGFAWVTSCSHIFCEQDGENHFKQNLTCPACDTLLSNDGDFYKTNLTPNEQYRGMVLAGQRPGVIMDICSKALAFWNYQISQEKAYYEWLARKLRDQMVSIEQQYGEMLAKSRNESQALKLRFENASRDLLNLQKRFDELSERYKEKSQQCRNVSTNYSCLQKRVLTPNTREPNTCQETSPSSSNIGQPKRFRPVTCTNFPALLSPYFDDSLKSKNDHQRQQLSLFQRQTAFEPKLTIFRGNPQSLASKSKFEFRSVVPPLKTFTDHKEKSSSKFNLLYSPFGGARSHKSDPATSCSKKNIDTFAVCESADKSVTDENANTRSNGLQYKCNFLQLDE